MAPLESAEGSSVTVDFCCASTTSNEHSRCEAFSVIECGRQVLALSTSSDSASTEVDFFNELEVGRDDGEGKGEGEDDDDDDDEGEEDEGDEDDEGEDEEGREYDLRAG